MSDQNSQFENDHGFENDPEVKENKMIEETSEAEAGNEVRGEDTPPASTEEASSFTPAQEPREDMQWGASRNSSASRRYQPPRRGVPVWALVLTVVLSVVLSFGGVVAGFVAARLMPDLHGDTSQTDSDDDPNGSANNGADETESVPNNFVENPEDILDKSEPNESIYGSAGEEVFAVSGVVRKVADAVVVINAKIVSSIFGQSTVQTSSGSGVVISEDGYILTCNHVVDGAGEVEVILNSGEKFDAMLVGSDAASDLAVLKINPEGKPLVFVEQGCSEDLVLGEQVVAIGNPLGTLEGSVTAGIVSATEREIPVGDGSMMTLIQTDAAINSGNSGGGLFNLDGQLIGIVNAKYSASGVEGLAFAIPIDSAYTVQLDLIEYGYVRGVVDHGLELLEVTESSLSYYHYRFGLEEAGVYIVDSEYTEELKNADLIRSVNGTKIQKAADFDAVLAECKVGDVLTLVIARRKTAGLQESWVESTVELELHEFVPDRLKDTLK